ncbi:MAG: radical SAM protein [Fervidicoccaceae archaeon]
MVIQKSSFGIEKVGKVIKINRPFPLIGTIAFGLIDRGYNNLQIRVTSLCSLSCIFCSVGSGPYSQRRAEYMLTDPEWLSEWVKYAISFKGNVHVLFDGIGDPIVHKDLPKFVQEVSLVRGVIDIAVETRLFPASKKLVEELWSSGARRLNVSLDTLNEERGKFLAGNTGYSVNKVVELILYARKNLGMDVHIAPVWIPGLNDRDIEEIIEFAIKNDLSSKVPPLGIQKYVAHKHGRKPFGVMEMGWDEFEEKLKLLEEKYKIKLLLSPDDYGLKVSQRIPPVYKKGDILKLSVVAEGLLSNEFLAVSQNRDRAFTLISRRASLSVGDVVVSRIIHDKDGILIAVPV